MTNFKITRRKGQRVSIQWICPECGKTRRTTTEYPRYGVTRTKYVTCSACKKRKRITIPGRTFED